MLHNTGLERLAMDIHSSLLGQGNFDIDFFITCHCFCIMRPKFLKLKRGQNAAGTFQIGNNERAQL